VNHKSQTVAAVLVSYNNAATIERLMESVRWADAIMVVDRGSTDGTLEIVRRFTNQVYFHPSDDPGFLRQYVIGLVPCDWVLILEPYEWVEEMLRHEIEGALLTTPAETTGYSIPIKLHYQKQWLAHGGFYPNRQVRLLRKGQGQVLGRAHHYAVQIPDHALRELDRAIGAEPYRSFSDILAGIDCYAEAEACRMLEAGGSFGLKSHPLTAILAAKWEAIYRYILKGGFLDGFHGLTFAIIRFVGIYARHAKLRAITNQ
jgi:glycosyltransferase involved in cell wall biosynthesis